MNLNTKSPGSYPPCNQVPACDVIDIPTGSSVADIHPHRSFLFFFCSHPNRLMLPPTDEPSILHHALLAKISRPMPSCPPPSSRFIFHNYVCAKLPAVRVFLELVYGPRVLDVFDSRVSIRRLWFFLFLFWFLSPPTVFYSM